MAAAALTPAVALLYASAPIGTSPHLSTFLDVLWAPVWTGDAHGYRGDQAPLLASALGALVLTSCSLVWPRAALRHLALASLVWYAALLFVVVGKGV